MSKKKLEITNSTNELKKTKKISKISRFRSHYRAVQSFVLVWLDQNIHGTRDDEHRENIRQIRAVVPNVKTFNDTNECVDFLRKLKNEKALMIVSGILGQTAVPLIHNLSKLDSIYVFCGLQAKHEQWAQYWTKIKGVFTQISPICDLLQQTIQKIEQSFVSLSFVTPTNVSDQNLDQLDQSFMYTQILKEILLEIKYNDESFKDLTTFFKEQCGNDAQELEFLKEFVDNYQKHSPIYWYTHPGFIHSMVNQSLRTHEVDAIIKMGFFIQSLHKHIENLHMKQMNDQEKQSFVVYRGQGLSKDEFEKMLQAKGGLVSFNSFLSTSKNRKVSLEFAEDALNNVDLVGVLFKMVIDPSELATPYAFIDNASYFKSEEEVLFSMHTVFRIGEIKKMPKNNRLYQVILTLTNARNKQLHALTELLRDETQGSTGWHRLGMLLIKLGKFDKAEQVYKTLFDLNTDENDKALLYHQLGLIKRNQGIYADALSLYKQALDIYHAARSSDDLDLAATYNNIGQVYCNMGDYSEALSYYEKSFETYKHTFPEDHPTLATLYNNIGLVYKSLGNYDRAFTSHEKALEIEEKSLPQNHPSLATSYKNLGLVYNNVGEYSKALSFHEKGLAIEQKTLPSIHPSLAISYNNIGLLYDNIGEYSKALSFYEKTLEIYQKLLPQTHPDFAMAYNNIGSVYKKMGEYSKALLFYKKALEIEEKLLTLSHPSLAISYSNIGIIYDCTEHYSEALTSHEKALGIYQKALPPEHPLLAVTYNNIASVHYNMTDYQTALIYYKKTLEIEQKHLTSNHPDLATSYNNIGLVYENLTEYTKAVQSHEKALQIYEKTLPPNHPNLVNSYNNIASVYRHIQEYSKALLTYEKALEICQIILPANHIDLITCYGNMSQTYELNGNHEAALLYYEKLVQAKEQTDLQDESTSKVSYNNIDRILHSKDASDKLSASAKLTKLFKRDTLDGKLPRRGNSRKSSGIHTKYKLNT